MHKSIENTKQTNGNGFKYDREKKAALIDKAFLEMFRDGTLDKSVRSLLSTTSEGVNEEITNKRLLQPIRAAFMQGGKRLRGYLVLTTIEAIRGGSTNFYILALVPEMLHLGTQWHDDIEDNSDFRRGRKAAYREWGTPTAINVGDFMLSYPARIITDSEKISSEAKIKIIKIYAEGLSRIGAGQAVDIGAGELSDPFRVSEDSYKQTAENKTGVLMGFSTMLGGIVAGAPDSTVEALGKYGRAMGTVFQYQDDILDFLPSHVSDNKGRRGEDIKNGKITLPIIYTLRTAKKEDAEKLASILELHTDQPYFINEAIKIMNRYGAVEHVKEAQKTLISEGWAGLDALLPESQAKTWLRKVGEFAITRDY